MIHSAENLPRRAEGQALTQWEYYRLSVDGPNVETALFELGQAGWELVAVIPESRIFFGFQCFLKRPLSPGDAPADPRRAGGLMSVRTNSLGRTNREGESPESLASMSWPR